jgi:hypothetical protein
LGGEPDRWLEVQPGWYVSITLGIGTRGMNRGYMHNKMGQLPPLTYCPWETKF